MVLPSRNGPDVKAAFRQVVGAANQCVVRVQCDGQDAALGTIVGPDGWVLTKASELKGQRDLPAPRRPRIRGPHRRHLSAAGIGLFPPLDLAMLKIDALHLPIIPWSTKRAGRGTVAGHGGHGRRPVGDGHRERAAPGHPARSAESSASSSAKSPAPPRSRR